MFSPVNSALLQLGVSADIPPLWFLGLPIKYPPSFYSALRVSAKYVAQIIRIKSLNLFKWIFEIVRQIQWNLEACNTHINSHFAQFSRKAPYFKSKYFIHFLVSFEISEPFSRNRHLSLSITKKCTIFPKFLNSCSDNVWIWLTFQKNLNLGWKVKLNNV